MFEYVDKIKFTYYNSIMTFKVEHLDAAKEEIRALEKTQQELLKAQYNIIETQGIEFVYVRHIQDKIFEIKSDELRSLFKYQAGRIIVVGVVFVKKTKKTPKEKIKLAKKRLKEI